MTKARPSESRIRFDEIEAKVPGLVPGIYEIHTVDGLPLKVGISGNLRKRLLQHRASLQRGLQFNIAEEIAGPEDITSKRSILAKHLYCDSSLTSEFDLKTEAGRSAFLVKKCYITFSITETREEARRLERQRELEGRFRYTGKVISRALQR
jgi:hypothetical protein